MAHEPTADYCFGNRLCTYLSSKTRDTFSVGGRLDDLEELVLERDEVDVLVALGRLEAPGADRHDALDLVVRPQHVRLVQRDRRRVVRQQAAVLGQRNATSVVSSSTHFARTH